MCTMQNAKQFGFRNINTHTHYIVNVVLTGAQCTTARTRSHTKCTCAQQQQRKTETLPATVEKSEISRTNTVYCRRYLYILCANIVANFGEPDLILMMLRARVRRAHGETTKKEARGDCQRERLSKNEIFFKLSFTYTYTHKFSVICTKHLYVDFPLYNRELCVYTYTVTFTEEPANCTDCFYDTRAVSICIFFGQTANCVHIWQ